MYYDIMKVIQHIRPPRIILVLLPVVIHIISLANGTVTSDFGGLLWSTTF
jgi:hypothetical protein